MRLFSVLMVLFSVQLVQASSAMKAPTSADFYRAQAELQKNFKTSTWKEVICFDRDGGDVALIGAETRESSFRALFNMGRFGQLPADRGTEMVRKGVEQAHMIYDASVRGASLRLRFDTPVQPGSRGTPVEMKWSGVNKYLLCFRSI